MIFGVLAGAAFAWYRYTFPYGRSHCCLKQLGLALRNYADLHDGHFPLGGGCPEASLSLLYQGDDGIGGAVLCGKTKSAEEAQAILERGGLLGPDSCDWHYVEGLTLCDNPQLALVWDKVGLGHNGQRLPNGGHTVWRLLGGEEVISGSDWREFLEEQERLMAARTAAAKKGLPALTAKIRLPSGEVVDRYGARFSLRTTCTTGGWARSAGPALERSELRWARLDDGDYTIALSLNGWKSRPVSVRVFKGKADPDAVILEMEELSAVPPPNPTH